MHQVLSFIRSRVIGRDDSGKCSLGCPSIICRGMVTGREKMFVCHHKGSSTFCDSDGVVVNITESSWERQRKKKKTDWHRLCFNNMHIIASMCGCCVQPCQDVCVYHSVLMCPAALMSYLIIPLAWKHSSDVCSSTWLIRLSVGAIWWLPSSDSSWHDRFNSWHYSDSVAL